MAKNFSDKLKQMQNGWGDSQKDYNNMFGGSDVPKGEYNFKLMKLELKESGNGNMYIERNQVIIDGEHEEETVRDSLMMHTPQAMVFVRRFIEQMGYDAPEDVTEIPEVLEAIAAEEPEYKGTLSFYNDRPQIRIIELLSEGESSGEDGDEEGDDGQEETAPDEENNEEGGEEENDDEGNDDGDGEDDEELIDRMLVFCATYDIEVDEDNATVDNIKEAIAELEFEEKDLDDEERALLEILELESCIKKPAPKKTVKKSVKKAPKKSVKKSVKKSSKKK